MSAYIWIALLCYFCFALSSLGDKLILSRAIRRPLVYAFYIVLLSPVAFVLAPFGLRRLDSAQIVIALLSGIMFCYALIFFYRAIRDSGASRAVTMVGGLQPLLVLLLAFLLSGERLSPMQLAAFAALLAGSVLISLEKLSGRWTMRAIYDALLAALLFALSLALSKVVYNNSDFVTGLIWTKLGAALGALTFLLHRPSRQILRSDIITRKPNAHKLLFIGNFALGAIATLLQNLAIARGSVSIVTALGGVQFVFVLILAHFLTAKYPKIFGEDLSLSVIIQKTGAVILIGAGLVLLNI